MSVISPQPIQHIQFVVNTALAEMSPKFPEARMYRATVLCVMWNGCQAFLLVRLEMSSF